MAVQPLSPATDRRLGGPLPRQPANQTRGHLEAINLWHKDHATPMLHAVLAVVSNCCPPLQGRFLTRYSPVRHFPLHPLSENSFSRFSFDLHVLSTPPAFVLSQDQTLYKIVSTQAFRLELIFHRAISIASFFCSVPSVIDSTRSPELFVGSFEPSVWCFSFVTLFNLQGTRRFIGGSPL